MRAAQGGENRCGQEQTQTKHEWVDMNDGDDRDRPSSHARVGRYG